MVELEKLALSRIPMTEDRGDGQRDAERRKVESYLYAEECRRAEGVLSLAALVRERLRASDGSDFGIQKRRGAGNQVGIGSLAPFAAR